MDEQNYQVEKTFFGGTIPGMQVIASNGAIVKVVFNIVMQREEDTLRRLARWIEDGGHGPEVANG